MKLLKNLRLGLLLASVFLAFTAFVLFFFDGVTSWTLSTSNFFTELGLNIKNAFIFTNVPISIIIYLLIVFSILIAIFFVRYFLIKNKKLPVFTLAFSVFSVIIAILFLACLQQQYFTRIGLGDFKVFVLGVSSILSPITLLPAMVFSIYVTFEHNPQNISHVTEEIYEAQNKTYKDIEEPIGNNTGEKTIIINNNFTTDTDSTPTVNIDLSSGIKKTKTVTESTRIFKRRSETNMQDLPDNNFVKKLYDANDSLKDVYNRLKHSFIEYGLRSTIGRSGESFRLNKTLYAKITITGDFIKAYYALNPEEFVTPTTPFTISNVAGYQEIPVLYKFNSKDGFNKAQTLVDAMCGRASLIKEDVEFINYAEEIISTYTA